MLNRAALIVRPAKPFIDWAKSLDDSDVLPDPNDEQTVYLIPQFHDDEEAESVLRRVFGEVFARALHEWHTDQTAWSRDRSLTAFKKWFTIEMHTLIEDLVDNQLEDDDRCRCVSTASRDTQASTTHERNRP